MGRSAAWILARVIPQKKNVPVVLISRSLPHFMEQGCAFRERFMTLYFQSRLEDLEEARVISTLWGCMKRRASRNLSYYSGIHPGFSLRGGELLLFQLCKDSLKYESLFVVRSFPFLTDRFYLSRRFRIKSIKMGLLDLDWSSHFVPLVFSCERG